MTGERTFELGGKPLRDLPDDVLDEALRGLSVIPEWRRAIQEEQGLRVRLRRESETGMEFEDVEPEHAYVWDAPGP